MKIDHQNLDEKEIAFLVGHVTPKSNKVAREQVLRRIFYI
jgi:hypothetical protein